MRTTAADWSLHQTKGENWLSKLRIKVRRVGRRAVVSEARAYGPIVQADAAAFVSAFMRIG